MHGQDMRPLASRSAIKRVHVKHCMHCTPLHSHHAYGHNDWLETGVLTPLRCSHHDFGHCFETGVLAPLSSEDSLFGISGGRRIWMPASATPICGLPRGDSTVRMCVHWRAGLQLNGCMSHLNSHHDFGHWFATGVLTPLLCSHHDFGHCFETGVVAPLSSEDSLFGISGGRHIWMPASAANLGAGGDIAGLFDHVHQRARAGVEQVCK